MEATTLPIGVTLPNLQPDRSVGGFAIQTPWSRAGPRPGPYFNGGNPAMQAWMVLLSEVYKMCMFATAESRAKAWPDSKGCDPFEARGAPGAAWSDYHLANHVLYLAK